MNTLATEIWSLLKAVDADFDPVLSARIDLKEYANKLAEKATVFFVYEQGAPVAFIANYCNNFSSETAFMSMLAISPEHRGKGMAKVLIQSSVLHIRQLGFKAYQLEVFKNNLSAIQLYTKMGFEVHTERDDRLVLIKKV